MHKDKNESKKPNFTTNLKGLSEKAIILSNANLNSRLIL